MVAAGHLYEHTDRQGRMNNRLANIQDIDGMPCEYRSNARRHPRLVLPGQGNQLYFRQWEIPLWQEILILTAAPSPGEPQ